MTPADLVRRAIPAFAALACIALDVHFAFREPGAGSPFVLLTLGAAALAQLTAFVLGDGPAMRPLLRAGAVGLVAALPLALSPGLRRDVLSRAPELIALGLPLLALAGAVAGGIRDSRGLGIAGAVLLLPLAFLPAVVDFLHGLAGMRQG